MAVLAYALLALLTLASAAIVIGARRPLLSGVALGLNALCAAGVVWTLSAPLVALVLAWIGVGVMLASLAIAGRARLRDAEPPHYARAELPVTVAVAIVFLVMLVGVMLTSYPPGPLPGSQGEAGRVVSANTAAQLLALASALYSRYTLGVLAMGLMVAVAMVGVRLRRGGS